MTISMLKLSASETKPCIYFDRARKIELKKQRIQLHVPGGEAVDGSMQIAMANLHKSFVSKPWRSQIDEEERQGFVYCVEPIRVPILLIQLDDILHFTS